MNDLTDQAAKTLSSIPALRASAVTALRAGGTAEVTITADDVTALQTSMRRSGLPPGLRTQMGRLGVKGADFARARKQMLNLPVSPASIAGALLIAPLADDKRTKLLATLPSELTRYAKQARSHPIARGHA